MLLVDYRREAERLLLWAIVERRQPLSSLTTDDAIAYRAFLRHPTPHARSTGQPRPRTTSAWRPFAGPLTARSTAYALAVQRALFGWLMCQRYVVLNPFAGVTVRGGATRTPFDVGRAPTDREWNIVRAVADRLERTGWTAPAAERLRFVLDFGVATGLRAQELVAATLGDIAADARGMLWLEVTGKGAKPGRVALPPRARYIAAHAEGAGPTRHACSLAADHPVGGRSHCGTSCGTPYRYQRGAVAASVR